MTKQRSPEASPLAKVFGKWPGEETDAELAAGLRSGEGSTEQAGPFPSAYNVDVHEGQWAVEVRGGGDVDYKTVFVSGVQSFTIAQEPSDGGEESRETCEWFATQFRTAMHNLGAPPERRGSGEAQPDRNRAWHLGRQYEREFQRRERVKEAKVARLRSEAEAANPVYSVPAPPINEDDERLVDRLVRENTSQATRPLQRRESDQPKKGSGVSTSPMAGSATSAGGPTKPARRSGEGTAVLGKGEEDYPMPASPSRPGAEPQRPERIGGDSGERPALSSTSAHNACEHVWDEVKATRRVYCLRCGVTHPNQIPAPYLSDACKMFPGVTCDCEPKELGHWCVHSLADARKAPNAFEKLVDAVGPVDVSVLAQAVPYEPRPSKATNSSLAAETEIETPPIQPSLPHAFVECGGAVPRTCSWYDEDYDDTTDTAPMPASCSKPATHWSCNYDPKPCINVCEKHRCRCKQPGADPSSCATPDRKRAVDLLDVLENYETAGPRTYLVERMLAAVRRETIEECAVECEREARAEGPHESAGPHGFHMGALKCAARIRDLQKEDKEER